MTVYERELRPGGHSHTVTVDYDGEPIAVDTGFIVYNELNYPQLTQLLAQLRVDTVASDMSFSLSADHGRFEWKGGGSNLIGMLKGLFAQPSNLLSPSYLWMLRDILRFNETSLNDLRSGRLAGLSLGQYFARTGCSKRLLSDYLAPMGGAIWSTSADEMLSFPAENFVAFFDNHRLLHFGRPVWRTGSILQRQDFTALLSAAARLCVQSARDLFLPGRERRARTDHLRGAQYVRRNAPLRAAGSKARETQRLDPPAAGQAVLRLPPSSPAPCAIISASRLRRTRSKSASWKRTRKDRCWPRPSAVSDAL